MATRASALSRSRVTRCATGGCASSPSWMSSELRSRPGAAAHASARGTRGGRPAPCRAATMLPAAYSTATAATSPPKRSARARSRTASAYTAGRRGRASTACRCESSAAARATSAVVGAPRRGLVHGERDADHAEQRLRPGRPGEERARRQCEDGESGDRSRRPRVEPAPRGAVDEREQERQESSVEPRHEPRCFEQCAARDEEVELARERAPVPIRSHGAPRVERMLEAERVQVVVVVRGRGAQGRATAGNAEREQGQDPDDPAHVGGGAGAFPGRPGAGARGDPGSRGAMARVGHGEPPYRKRRPSASKDCIDKPLSPILRCGAKYLAPRG